jgi:hypothetical protein
MKNLGQRGDYRILIKLDFKSQLMKKARAPVGKLQPPKNSSA